jgi:spore coat polysaccharide biosynthesis protein SpsF
VIIQARMGSTRLPGKVLLDLAGKPMLVHVIERARRAKRVKDVIVATTSDPSDEPITKLCEKNGYSYFRGSPLDVLDRFYQAAQACQATNIVRLTGDCPLIDPMLIDQTILAFHTLNPASSSTKEINRTTSSTIPSASNTQENTPKEKIQMPGLPIKQADLYTKRFDFACTRLPPPWHRTYPIGQDIELCTFASLERAWKESNLPYHREHVMPFLYEETRSMHFAIQFKKYPGKSGFSEKNDPLSYTSAVNSALKLVSTINPDDPHPFFVLRIDHDPDFGTLRWTVDTLEDLEYVRKILALLQAKDPSLLAYSWYDILELVQEKPELLQADRITKAKDYREVDPRYKR